MFTKLYQVEVMMSHSETVWDNELIIVQAQKTTQTNINKEIICKNIFFANKTKYFFINKKVIK